LKNNSSIFKSLTFCQLNLVFSIAICLIFPIFSRQILRLPQLAFANFTDSVFYLFYSQSFQELFLRHGFIYYASRFGAIFPDAIAFNLFGPTDGPVFLRPFLTCLVSGALFLVGRLYFTPLIGILASLLWSFQPVAARLWCTTYLDSGAVPFLILGVCLLLLFESDEAIQSNLREIASLGDIYTSRRIVEDPMLGDVVELGSK
jgi:hypothetical protein